MLYFHRCYHFIIECLCLVSSIINLDQFSPNIKKQGIIDLKQKFNFTKHTYTHNTELLSAP